MNGSYSKSSLGKDNYLNKRSEEKYPVRYGDTSMPKENDQDESQFNNEESNIISRVVKDCAKELTLYFLTSLIAIIFVNLFGENESSIEILSILIATSLFTIISAPIIQKTLWSNFISVGTRTSKIKAVLLILVAIATAIWVAYSQKVINLDAGLLIGFILLNACMALIAPTISSEHTLLRPIMAAVPGANLVTVAIIGGASIFGGFMPADDNSDFGNLSGLADLTIVNNCEIPIYYGGFGNKIPRIDIEPFGIQTIQIQGKPYDIYRDGSKIIIKGIYPLPIKVEKDTRIIFDGKEIEPGSGMILNIIPNSSHRLIIGCRV